MCLVLINKWILFFWEIYIFIIIVYFYSSNSFDFLFLFIVYVFLLLILFGYIYFKNKCNILKIFEYIYDNILVLFIFFTYGFLSLLFFLGTISSLISGEKLSFGDYFLWVGTLLFFIFIIRTGRSFLINRKVHGIGIYFYSLFAMLGLCFFGIFAFLIPEGTGKIQDVLIFYTPGFILISGVIEYIFIDLREEKTLKELCSD